MRMRIQVTKMMRFFADRMRIHNTGFGSFFYWFIQTVVVNKSFFTSPVKVMLRTDSAAGVVVEAGGAVAPEAAAAPTVAAAAAPNPWPRASPSNSPPTSPPPLAAAGLLVEYLRTPYLGDASGHPTLTWCCIFILCHCHNSAASLHTHTHTQTHTCTLFFPPLLHFVLYNFFIYHVCQPKCVCLCVCGGERGREERVWLT